MDEMSKDTYMLMDNSKDIDNILKKLDWIKCDIAKGAENMNDLGLAAVMNNNRNDMWNNPFMYLILLAMFGNNGGIFGGNNNNASEAQLLNSIGEIKAALTGNGMQNNQIAADIGRVAQAMGYNKDFVVSAVNANREALCHCCSDLQRAICENGHQTAMQLCNLGNMIQSGNYDITNAINACCCQTNLNMERNKNDLEKALFGVSTNMNAQFTQGRFENQMQNNQVLAAITADGEKTRNLLVQQAFDKVVRERDLAINEISQQKQTAQLEEAINAKFCQVFGQPYGNHCGGFGYNGWNNWNQPYPSPLFPNGSQTYPLFVTPSPTPAAK